MPNQSIVTIEQVLTHFRSSDPILYQVAVRIEPERLLRTAEERDLFRDLCREIIGQQLSTKAASTIYSRFEALFPGNLITPEVLATLSIEQLRAVGLSNAKAKYVLGIADAVISKTINIHSLHELDDELVITELTKLKGVGTWTAEMFLMFTLGRPDVFSVKDLGLKRAIERLYNLSNPTAEEMLSLAANWSPYRTYACRVLWQSLDNNPNL